jgi:catechol 2,3-dioxygenase-like lactoylglutathione lyase family enzyme
MSVTSIDHVLVLSDDIDAARDFYCATLGLAPGPRPALEFAGHWLYAGGTARLHLADRAQYRAHARRLGLAPRDAGDSIDHIAFVDADYGEALARLERAGVDAVPNAVAAAGLRQLFFAGPEGVGIEVNVADAPPGRG